MLTEEEPSHAVGDGNRGQMSISPRNIWENRRIADPQPLVADHPAKRVDNRLGLVGGPESAAAARV
jgi:hypothetical protein